MYISSRHLPLLNKLIGLKKDTDNPVFTVNRVSNHCELRGYVYFLEITITLKKLSGLSMEDSRGQIRYSYLIIKLILN